MIQRASVQYRSPTSDVKEMQIWFILGDERLSNVKVIRSKNPYKQFQLKVLTQTWAAVSLDTSDCFLLQGRHRLSFHLFPWTGSYVRGCSRASETFRTTGLPSLMCCANIMATLWSMVVEWSVLSAEFPTKVPKAKTAAHLTCSGTNINTFTPPAVWGRRSSLAKLIQKHLNVEWDPWNEVLEVLQSSFLYYEPPQAAFTATNSLPSLFTSADVKPNSKRREPASRDRLHKPNWVRMHCSSILGCSVRDEEKNKDVTLMILSR